MPLDLASGQHPREGYEGVDIRPLGQRYIGNLMTYPWLILDCLTVGPRAIDGIPFPTGSVDGLYSSHFVEHIPDLVGFMNEAWRVLADGAHLEIIHPYQFSLKAWQDPTHVRALNENSWAYYNAGWRTREGLDHMGIAADFDEVSTDFMLAPEWEQAKDDIGPRALARAIRNGVNVVDECRVILECRKDRPVDEETAVIDRAKALIE